MHKHHFQTHMFRIKTYNGKTIFLSNYHIYIYIYASNINETILEQIAIYSNPNLLYLKIQNTKNCNCYNNGVQE